jgi:predicted acetyltransferase
MMQNPSIRLIGPHECNLLNNLLQLYLYDSSIYDRTDVDAYGLYPYEATDVYLTGKGYWAYIIEVQKKSAGFVLIRQLGFDLDGDPIRCISEFFVMRRYRRHGVGRAAAIKVLMNYPGTWWVNQNAANTGAGHFWRKVIAEVTGDDYYDLTVERDWQSPVQVFKVRPEMSAMSPSAAPIDI